MMLRLRLLRSGCRSWLRLLTWRLASRRLVSWRLVSWRLAMR